MLFPLYFPLLLQVTLYAYIGVACKRIFDIIPKQVHHFLVAGTCDGLYDWMLDAVSSEDLKKLLVEDSQGRLKRKDRVRRLASFNEGIDILAATTHYS